VIIQKSRCVESSGDFDQNCIRAARGFAMDIMPNAKRHRERAAATRTRHGPHPRSRGYRVIALVARQYEE